jgi:hypothetical protein
LTAAEQMRLDQLARQLREDDPRLAAALTGPDNGPRAPAHPPHWALLVSIVAAAGVLVLLACVVGGVGGAVAVVATLASALVAWQLARRRTEH